ncbi:MAG: hypothetical protein ACYC8T_08575 [Myxococcaceae bacterium]
MGGALTLAGLLLSALAVEGGATCPSPAQVAERLRRLLPASADSGGYSARVEQDGAGVRIELLDGSGSPVGARVLEGSPRCEDLASASAVVIASWVAELGANPPAAEEPPKPPSPAPPTAPEGPGPTFEIAVGAVGSYSGDFALGALVEASLTPAGGVWGAQVTLGALGAHDASLASNGKATWQRFALGLGAHRRLRPGTWKVDLQAKAVAALLAVSGDEQNQGVARTGFDPGLSLGVRALSFPGLWVGAFAAGWLRPGAGQDPPPKLPQFEAFLMAGVAWGSE